MHRSLCTDLRPVRTWNGLAQARAPASPLGWHVGLWTSLGVEHGEEDKKDDAVVGIQHPRLQHAAALVFWGPRVGVLQHAAGCLVGIAPARCTYPEA